MKTKNLYSCVHYHQHYSFRDINNSYKVYIGLKISNFNFSDMLDAILL